MICSNKKEETSIQKNVSDIPTLNTLYLEEQVQAILHSAIIQNNGVAGIFNDEYSNEPDHSKDHKSNACLSSVQKSARLSQTLSLSGESHHVLLSFANLNI